MSQSIRPFHSSGCRNDKPNSKEYWTLVIWLHFQPAIWKCALRKPASTSKLNGANAMTKTSNYITTFFHSSENLHICKLNNYRSFEWNWNVWCRSNLITCSAGNLKIWNSPPEHFPSAELFQPSPSHHASNNRSFQSPFSNIIHGLADKNLSSQST